MGPTLFIEYGKKGAFTNYQKKVIRGEINVRYK
jgi:hypothetical protein